jgi:hypothetical protein
MSALVSGTLTAQSRPRAPEGRDRSDYPEWTDRRQEARSGLPLVALAVVALGVVAAVYLGPDIARYMRIRNM